MGGVLLRLIDTAGIHDTADTVEQLGVERSRAALAGAELALAVVDGPLTEEDREILREAARCPHWLLIWSKADLGGSPSPLPEGLCPDGVVTLSSRTGEGLSDLEAAVEKLYPMGAAPAGQMLTNPRQAQAVNRALEALRGGPDRPGGRPHPRCGAHRYGGGSGGAGRAHRPHGAAGFGGADFLPVLCGKIKETVKKAALRPF